MAFASSLFCSSKFLEHTHTLLPNASLCYRVLTTPRTYVPLPFSIFGSFYPNVRFFFFMSKYWLEIYRRGRKKNSVQQKENTILVFFFFAGRSFLRPPLSGALGDRLYRLYEKPPLPPTNE